MTFSLRLARRISAAGPLVAVLFSVLFSFSGPRDANAQTETAPDVRRALWVVRDLLVDPTGIDRMVSDAGRAGITDILLQVRGRGDAYYRSDLVPSPETLDAVRRRHPDFDPLQRTLVLAHEQGIRVHAWVNVYLAAGFRKLPVGHVVLEHPDWVAADAAQSPMTVMTRRRFKRELTEGIYLDPGLPEVTAHFVDLCRELTKNYALDGIHLDYVRYPHMEIGYSDGMRRVFQARTGIDPLELVNNRNGLRSELSKEDFAELERSWRQFRADQVTNLVAEVRHMLRTTRPGMVLSAAVKPDHEGALSRYGQDWVRWIEEDLVDVVAPMMYSTSWKAVRDHMERAAALVPPQKIWAGIAVYNQSLASAARKIDTAHTTGLGGVSIFSYNSVPGGVQGLLRLSRR